MKCVNTTTLIWHSRWADCVFLSFLLKNGFKNILKKTKKMMNNWWNDGRRKTERRIKDIFVNMFKVIYLRKMGSYILVSPFC